MELIPWVPETFITRFPVLVKPLFLTRAARGSAFGPKVIPLRARKTSGTQGMELNKQQKITLLTSL